MLGVASSELSAATRARILETAWQRVRDHGPSAVGVKDIAAAAGVSRQLVYFHYGNRAGLLVAMARHRDEASGFRRRVAETRALAPVAALEALVRAWCDYVPDLLPVARALEAAHVTGDEGGAAWRDRIGDLHEALRQAVERVADADRLAAGWTVGQATDWIWAGVQPSRYAHLVQERGWTPEAFTERTVSALLGELVGAPATA
jgi:AcrR family transcriptional regulator